MNKNEKLAALYGLLITLIGFSQAEEWLHNIVKTNGKITSIKTLKANGINFGAAVHLTNEFSGLTADDLNEIITSSGWD